MSPTGPLAGIRVIEIASIGPAPFGASVLAGLGAEVVRLHRPGDPGPVDIAGADVDKAGRESIEADLKTPAGRELAARLATGADALVEGSRPGVMERLDLGPETLQASNPKLVYCRMTGYGQRGPLAQTAGHDINYLAMSGVLHLIGREGERPLPPLNLVADYGGGGMLLALGLLAGVLEARRTGRGRVVDVAMVDGAAQLATMFFSLSAAGSWGARGTNFVDSGAHFYEVYETADGRHMAVGAVEPQFYANLVAVLGLTVEEAPQWDRSRWRTLKARFAEIFATQDLETWTARFGDVDACATPVLTPAEAASHPHARARGSFRDGIPVPAPCFETTAPAHAGRADAAAAGLGG